MKFVIQRVESASVRVDNTVVGRIQKGLMVLVGITETDTKETADYMVKKLVNMRIFTDEEDKMNLSVKDVQGEVLLVSQFTLYADCAKGNRPSFIQAAKPEYANELYQYVIAACKKEIPVVEKGKFGAHMQAELINDGPVTIVLEHE